MINDDGFAMAADELAFQVAPDDLVLAGRQVLPERGDEITRTVGTETQVYVVNAEVSSDRYRIDALNTCLTIRSKLKART